MEEKTRNVELRIKRERLPSRESELTGGLMMVMIATPSDPTEIVDVPPILCCVVEERKKIFLQNSEEDLDGFLLLVIGA